MVFPQTKRLIALASVLLAASCLRPASRIVGGEEQTCASTHQDTTITLSVEYPRDPVVIKRGEISIVLSLSDVESYYSRWPLSPETAEFREGIRREYATAGRVQLDNSQLADVLAGRLIESGRAVITSATRGRPIPCVGTVLHLDEKGTSVIRHRAFYAPDGTLIFRFLDGVTVS